MKPSNNVDITLLTYQPIFNQISRWTVEFCFIVSGTRAKMNNLINVVNNLLQCCAAHCQQCAAPCQQLLSTSIVHSCSPSTTIVQSLLTTINKLFSSTIVSSCSNNIVTTIVLCQHRTTIDRTILINIVNSTSVVEP